MVLSLSLLLLSLLFVEAAKLVAGVGAAQRGTTTTSNPYPLAENWTYVFSANRSASWPQCRFRFLSFNGPLNPNGFPPLIDSTANEDGRTSLLTPSFSTTTPTSSFKRSNYCDQLNLWDGAGGNQEFKLVKPPTTRSRRKLRSDNCFLFAMTTPSCQNETDGEKIRYVAYNVSDCFGEKLLLVTEAELLAHRKDLSSTFEFSPSRLGIQEPGAFVISAVDRKRESEREESQQSCNSVLSFDNDLSCQFNPTAVSLALPKENDEQHQGFVWFATPANPPEVVEVMPAVSGFCADPFLWHDRQLGPSRRRIDGDDSASSSKERFYVSCTGGEIQLYYTDLDSRRELNSSTKLDSVIPAALASDRSRAEEGDHHRPEWIRTNARWAPETIQIELRDSGRGGVEVMALCDQVFNDTSGPHRIGYVVSPSGQAGLESFTNYSPSRLMLSPGTAGDIDPHFFQDPSSNKTYLVWKEDCNRIGLLETKIWAQEISINPQTGNLSQIGEPRIIMDSCCEWWIVGFNGINSSLVEGPEIIYRRGFYYLFFAAGRYNDYSYTEGVARSPSIWGPYVKQKVPLLNTGMMPHLSKEFSPRPLVLEQQLDRGGSKGSDQHHHLSSNQNRRIQGPGHAGFWWRGKSSSTIEGEMEQEPQYVAVYHAHIAGQPRTVYLCDIVFDDDEATGAPGWPRAILPHW